ncbi:MAG TPA: hypothetical protein VLZ50_02665 [Terracidiphilus sp.]|nr:hypothetical protein [Terracidiphilus sp.]
MFRRLFPPTAAFVIGFGLIAASLAARGQDTDRRGRKFKLPPPTSTISVTVLRNVDGKPIENAAVIFHPVEGEHDKGGMELKTNEDGKTMIDVLPIGDTVLLQVLAKGFQTFGRECKVDKPNMAFQVRLKRPGEQYSIYKKHAEKTEGGASLTVTDSCSSIGSESADTGENPDVPQDKPTDPNSNAPQSNQPNAQ